MIKQKEKRGLAFKKRRDPLIKMRYFTVRIAHPLSLGYMSCHAKMVRLGQPQSTSQTTKG